MNSDITWLRDYKYNDTLYATVDNQVDRSGGHRLIRPLKYPSFFGSREQPPTTVDSAKVRKEK